MAREAPADIIFRRTGPHYRATPPSLTVNPRGQPTVLIRNLTGSEVTVWAPQNVLLETPHSLKNLEEHTFTINPDLGPDTYVYTAYVVGSDQFVEGNSPPAIIIDK